MSTFVAVCGSGRMGAQLARRIAGGGFPLTVWNRTASTAEALAAELGIDAAAKPPAADLVIVMVTDGNALHAVLDDLLPVLAPGALVVDCSTSGVLATRRAARRCADVGVAFVDCPVSGSTAVAGRGELGLMAGGSVTDVERATPVLRTFGRTLVHVGPVGAGAAAKVAVNGLLHTFNTALAEVLVAAERQGVDRTALYEVLAGSVLWNTYLSYKRDAYLSPSEEVAFDLATAAKDLGLAVDAAAGLPGSVTGRAHEIHRDAVAAGYGDRDIAALAGWFAGASTERN
ncbi:NAD(P)-dependent oxidoreductase [Cryptosporangium phraense]|uniref:NAD(P)-dependent oxidoreductase n=1 Tax=Cryptosporangium phraense TaxID=2593070 RepID=A0A545APZ9_9ACTN|nr:NAD(P)-dependent oxidoreductase [Cryptosporangium phraense]TQS43408.1 NAD(P)-dependent oxidoreductase [Cryptosporangium phraense]